MKPLTAFGLVAVTAMLVSYALEKRSHWFILAFAGSCALGSAYGFLQGAWPFGIVEAIWAVVAIQLANSGSPGEVIPSHRKTGLERSQSTKGQHLLSGVTQSANVEDTR